MNVIRRIRVLAIIALLWWLFLVWKMAAVAIRVRRDRSSGLKFDCSIYAYAAARPGPADTLAVDDQRA